MLLRPTLASFKSNVLILHETKAFATPKRRTPARTKWRRLYGADNMDNGRLIQPKRNIVSCQDCGNFHEIHTICRHCFEKIHASSATIMDKIRQPNPMWFDTNLSQTAANPGRQIIDNSPRETFVNQVKESSDKQHKDG